MQPVGSIVFGGPVPAAVGNARQQCARAHSAHPGGGAESDERSVVSVISPVAMWASWASLVVLASGQFSDYMKAALGTAGVRSDGATCGLGSSAARSPPRRVTASGTRAPRLSYEGGASTMVEIKLHGGTVEISADLVAEGLSVAPRDVP